MCNLIKTMSSLLTQIEKPLRYIDHELNAFHKDFDKAKARFCFIYPDIYEIGISHLGLKILYSIVNQSTDAMADRAYTPWIDLGDKLLKNNIPLSALESKKPVKNFDCIGFSLQTELVYTNILYTLDLSQIPLRSVARNEEHPIILAGGINAINPHPMSLFIDAFFLGEAEDGILRVKEIFIKEKRRKERLKSLAELDFIYVPSIDKELEQKETNFIKAKLSKKALKYSCFSSSKNTHNPQLVPLLEGTHNRYTAEIMRGCTRGCRFCQAGMFYRPTREKNPDIVVEQLLEDTQRSGWDSCGLLSLSSSDYTQIKPLLNRLITHLKDTGVSISMPSLRIDSIDSNLTDMINQLKKSGITLAPEAGTQRLRDIINKNLTEAEILDAVATSYRAGVKLIKLYFMIGLPFERDEDIDGIISLVEKIIQLTEKKMRINVSISPFVPKPMTPFQWAKMEGGYELLGKALKIKHSFIKYKHIKINYHTIELSFLEAVLSRGNSDTSFVIEKAYLNGAKFDSWREHFDYSVWTKAAISVDFDWDKPINGYELDEVLPWDNIHIGVSKRFLMDEYLKAEKSLTTADCRFGTCSRCGACTDSVRSLYIETTNDQNFFSNTESIERQNKVVSSERILYRVYFAKQNDLKYLSHLDFLRLIHRLLMLSGLPIVFSEGFNPHPKTAFCPPLSSGLEGQNEFFDIWMTEAKNDSTIIDSLSKVKMSDITFQKVEVLFENNKYKPYYKPIGDFKYESICVEFLGIRQKNIESYKEKLNFFYDGKDTYLERERKGAKRIIDLNDIIINCYFTEDSLYISKKIQGASIFDILKKIFDITRDEIDDLRITRMLLLSDTIQSL